MLGLFDQTGSDIIKIHSAVNSHTGVDQDCQRRAQSPKIETTCKIKINKRLFVAILKKCTINWVPYKFKFLTKIIYKELFLIFKENFLHSLIHFYDLFFIIKESVLRELYSSISFCIWFSIRGAIPIES